jgi:4-diphosphocytidyl-2C-methyl-D-erythritol kinase
MDELGFGDREAVTTQPDWRQWPELLAGPLLSRLVNDLELPAFALCPPLAVLRADIEQSLGQIVRMSGSGSSLFTLFDNLPEAESAAARVQDRHNVRALATELAPMIDDDLAG